MAYTKRYGHIRVKILKVWPDFIDAICVKTGREITFQLKYKIQDGLRNFLEMHIGTNTQLSIYCRPHTEENMYWYSKISRGEHLGSRSRIMKKIAMEDLMRTVEEDHNPVRSTKRQKLLTGRRGIPISQRTSGKIGGAIMKNINRENVMTEEMQRKIKEETGFDL